MVKNCIDRFFGKNPICPNLTQNFVFVIANFPMMQCLLQDQFLISTVPLDGQITYHVFFDGLRGFIRGTLALTFNYLIYFIPSFIAYKWLLKVESIDSTIF